MVLGKQLPQQTLAVDAHHKLSLADSQTIGLQTSRTKWLTLVRPSTQLMSDLPLFVIVETVSLRQRL